MRHRHKSEAASTDSYLIKSFNTQNLVLQSHILTKLIFRTISSECESSLVTICITYTFHFRNYHSIAAINLLTKSHSERQSFDSNHGICFKRPHSYRPLSESFWEKVVKKTAQKQKEIVGAVPGESLLALGRYLNQMFTIQGNYKNRTRIRRTLRENPLG